MRLGAALTAAAVLALVPAAAATAAPGQAAAGAPQLATASPVAGSTVPGPPPVVTLVMSAPVRTATVTVTDGCGRPVPGGINVAGPRVSVRLGIDHARVKHEDHSAATGGWVVDWRTVTADGAASTGKHVFALAGKRRCALEQEQADAQVAAFRSAAPTGGEGGRAFLTPLLAVAGAGLLLTALQLVRRLRRTTP